MTPPPDGQIVTFYSYKGGTGRSMMLANVAWILASNGKRVLMVDWDLEAPGLHRYFHPFLGDKQLAATPGLIDWVLRYQKAVSALSLETTQVPPDLLARETEFSSYVVSLQLEEFELDNFGALHFIPAGKQDDGYAARVNRFNWQQLYDKLGGFEFFETVKLKMREQYDYILIDSRTGVSDTSGVCTLQMPDTLVVCFTLNAQSILGASGAAKAAQEERSKDAGVKQFRVFPVPTRIERNEKLRLDSARKAARAAFQSYPSGLPGPEIDRYWGRIEVPYEAFYAYEEVLAVFADRPGDVTSMLASAERLAGYLTHGDVTDLTPIPEAQRAAIVGQYLRQADLSRDLGLAAERVFSGLEPKEEELARQMFLRFVFVSSGVAAARPVPPEELERFKPVLDRFVKDDLIATRPATADGSAFYELSDPKLLQAWTRFAEWLKADLGFVTWRVELSSAINAWKRTESDTSFLLRGKALETAEKWWSGRQKQLDPHEIAFIRAGSSQKAEEEKERKKQLRAEQAAARELEDQKAKIDKLNAQISKLKEQQPQPADIVLIDILKTRFHVLQEQPLYRRVAVLILIAAVLAALSTGAYYGYAWLHQARSQQAAKEAYGKGESLMSVEKYKEAVTTYNTVIRNQPDDENAYVKRGASYSRLKQYNSAIADLSKALKLKPDDIEAYYERGVAQYELEQYDAAIADLDKALKLRPDYAYAFYVRGQCYSRLGRFQLALQDLNEAIRINPNYIWPYYERGVANDATGEYQLAVTDLKRVIKQNPDYAYSYIELGYAYSQLKDYKSALEQLNKGIQLDPKYANGYANRAGAYFGLADYPRALEDYSKAIQLDPKSGLYRWMRAGAYDKLGDKTAAESDRAASKKLGYQSP